jgi:hypothetical protein
MFQFTKTTLSESNLVATKGSPLTPDSPHWDALENTERDRTIYYRWHLVLLNNEIFAGFRDHPRFGALVERIQRDLSRQREQQ